MKRLLFKSKIALASLMFAGSLMAQEPIKQERPLNNFNALDVTGNENVTITQGDQNILTVTCTSGNPEDLISNINDNTLSFARKSGNSLKGLKLKLQFKQLNSISLSGASDLKSEGIVKAEDLGLVVSGAGDLKLNIDANNISSTISGAGDVELSGKANTHTTNISGAGDLKAINLETKTTTAIVSGSGDAKVNASDVLTATITGAGGIFYKTEPAVKNIDVSAAGTARKLDGSAPAKDSTRIKLGDTQVIIIPGEDEAKLEYEFDFSDTLKTDKKKKKKSTNAYHHWAGLELGVNGLAHSGMDLTPPAGWPELEVNYGRSFNWRLNIAEKDFNLYQEKVNLITGLAFEWSNYGLLGSYAFTPDVNKLTLAPTNISYKKNRLQSIWVDVPALIEFNTSNKVKKSAHIALGLVGGYRLGANVKQVYYINDKKYKNKTKDDYNLNDYKVSATARVGYGKVTFFGEYNLTGMFKNGQGPWVNPLTVGVTLIPFD